MPQHNLQLCCTPLLLAGVQGAIPARAGIGPRVLRPYVQALDGVAPGLVYGVLLGFVSHYLTGPGTRPG